MNSVLEGIKKLPKHMKVGWVGYRGYPIVNKICFKVAFRVIRIG